MSALHCAYLDLDGTLLGRGASILRDGGGGFSLLGVRALEACARADVDVCFFSGRRRDSLFWDARMLGVGSYVFEAGAGVVVDGETHWLTDERFEGIARSGAPALLLERFDLEYHDPWHEGREVSHLLRGTAEAAEADALLEAEGLGHLRLIDNGGISRPGMRAYHLVPRDVSKARGVAVHQRIRGHDRGSCIAVGDSREDMAAAEVVSAFWLVANGPARDPSLGKAAPNVRVAAEGHGAGVYEAVVTELAERRAS